MSQPPRDRMLAPLLGALRAGEIDAFAAVGSLLAAAGLGDDDDDAA
jgi:hypothetical protein